jgi:23S rRNA-/tRNA-specific pseudouridylate synthase
VTSDLVLLREAGLLVADKPPGLASTGRTLDDPDCLQAVLERTLGLRRVWAVHQLDRDTSGLNLFVTRRTLVERWAARLKDGTKTYVAIAHGRLEGPPVEVDLPIGTRRLPDGRQVPSIYKEGGPGARPARSTVHPIATIETPGDAPPDARGAPPGGPFSLVLVRIHTGRTHQARLHLAALGHPLVGERLHRDPPCALHPRHALHAWRLDLPGSAPGERRTFEAPIPDDLRDLAARLGLDLSALDPLPAP